MPEGKKKIALFDNKIANSVAPRFHIEIDKIANGLSVCVNGVSSVVDFCEEYAVLKLGKGKVRVCGAGLSITLYENKIAEITGKVGAIEFI